MLNLTMNQLSGMNCHYIHYSFEYFLDSMARLGMQNIEIWGASPHYFADYFTTDMIRHMKKEIAVRGLRLVCLTPEQVTYPINIAAREDYLRKLSVNNHIKTLEHAAELGSGLMLLTPGYGNNDEDRAEAWSRSAESIALIARHAEKLGVTIALEHLSPISSNLINTAAQLRKMLDEVRSPRLKAMFDVVQVGIVNETVNDYFKLLGEDIVHIHLVDGTPGGHLALGEGKLPLEQYIIEIAQNGYKGFMSMEIADRRYFAHPEKADEVSIEKYKNWISNLSV